MWRVSGVEVVGTDGDEGKNVGTSVKGDKFRVAELQGDVHWSVGADPGEVGCGSRLADGVLNRKCLRKC